MGTFEFTVDIMPLNANGNTNLKDLFQKKSVATISQKWQIQLSKVSPYIFPILAIL